MTYLGQHQVEELTNSLLYFYPKVYVRDVVATNPEDFRNKYDKVVRRELWLQFQEETDNENSLKLSIRFFKSKIYKHENLDYSTLFYKRYFFCYLIEEIPKEEDILGRYYFQAQSFLDFT